MQSQDISSLSKWDKFRKLLVATRPNFLVLPIALVTLGFSIAFENGYSWNWPAFVMTLVGAIFAHAWVNLHNEITDSKNKLDAQTPKTPFSGGTGTFVLIPSLLPLANQALLVLFGILMVILMAFTWIYGIELFFLAFIGGILMLSYSRWLVHRPWLCWASAGLAFGPLMVLSAFWIASQTFTVESFVLSFVVFFWVNNLLLLNQVPDYFADQTVGRKNLVIKYGLKNALWFYSAGAFLSLCCLWSMAIQGQTYGWIFISFIWSAFIIWQIKQVFSTYHQMSDEFKMAFERKVSDLNSLPEHIATHTFEDWHRVLGINVAINILIPLSLSALLILGS
ncbi:prenyltransferase [Thiomicrorhabdus indica]|uniref:prenyltransferase n=1 Tax=Thiomicrorhabdus indica TaxID=2267253 RepID=UPI00102D8142|nr:prenyltransferase [Thiomicrorhabdus indica]